MTYHPLTEDTGQTPERRREEAEDLLAMISDYTEQLTDREREFVEEMAERDWASPKQLLWLQDIWARFA